MWLKFSDIITNTLDGCVCCLVTVVMMSHVASAGNTGEFWVDACMDVQMQQFNIWGAEVLLHSHVTWMICC